MAHIDDDELVDEWWGQKRTEDAPGVENLSNLVQGLDDSYIDIDRFLEDNPGAIEVLVEWISNQTAKTQWWADHLRVVIEQERG